jgi:hypothetical protein
VEPVSGKGAKPKLEVLKKMMGDMGCAICAVNPLVADAFYLTSQILAWERA